jgi:hypothetical protein
MVTQLTKRLISIIAVLWIAGCATLTDVIEEKQEGGGTTKVYPVNNDQAWEIARTVFRWSGTDAIEEHRDQGYMLTSSGMNLVSAGAVMGAWVEPVGQEQTRVTVVTKRRIQTNIATTLTETTFHKRFAKAVEIVKAGEPLPLTLPREDNDTQ